MNIFFKILKNFCDKADLKFFYMDKGLFEYFGNNIKY